MSAIQKFNCLKFQPSSSKSFYANPFIQSHKRCAPYIPNAAQVINEMHLIHHDITFFTYSYLLSLNLYPDTPRINLRF